MLDKCILCGAADFREAPVLWPELCQEWSLNEKEIAYIDKQQGCHCFACKCNLRTQVLAKAIIDSCRFEGLFFHFVRDARFQRLRILEINHAGNLHALLTEMPGHKLVEYPECDMMALSFKDATFDLVVHSDTLEHIADAARGLRECLRVLVPNGKAIFTVPVIVGRMSRLRHGLSPSYHGSRDLLASDHLVYTEFGSDVWELPLKAGFTAVKIHQIDFPTAIALEASK